MTGLDRKALVDRLRELLDHEADVELAVLIGSRARGRTGGIDVDLLVHVIPKSDARFEALGHQLEAELGVTVDIATLSTAARSPRFRDRAIEDGIVIVDRFGHWPKLCAAPDELVRERGADKLTDGEVKAVKFLRTDEWFEQEIARLRAEREG